MNALAKYLPAGMTPVDLLAILFGVAAFLVIIAVWQALLVRDPIVVRAKSLLARRAELMAQYLGHTRPRQHQAAHGAMTRVVQRFRLLQGQKTSEMRERLAQAGLRSREALVTFLFCKLCLPLTFGMLGLLFFEGMGAYNLSSTNKFIACIVCVLLGAVGPGVWIRNKIAKRQAAVRKGVPDALDLLVICVEAGLSLDAALTRVSRELGRGAPELADEFQLTALELGFLPERRQALENLSKRVTLPSIRAVVSSLLQTEKYGTPLAQSLRVLAAEFRNERMMRAEEKAARLPAILTVPMVVFILPTLFIVLIGPAIIKTIDALTKM
jgi:tight adherence protein C